MTEDDFIRWKAEQRQIWLASLAPRPVALSVTRVTYSMASGGSGGSGGPGATICGAGGCGGSGTITGHLAAGQRIPVSEGRALYMADVAQHRKCFAR